MDCEGEVGLLAVRACGDELRANSESLEEGAKASGGDLGRSGWWWAVEEVGGDTASSASSATGGDEGFILGRHATATGVAVVWMTEVCVGSQIRRVSAPACQRKDAQSDIPTTARCGRTPRRDRALARRSDMQPSVRAVRQPCSSDVSAITAETDGCISHPRSCIRTTVPQGPRG